MAGQEQRAGVELYYRLAAGSKRTAEWFQQTLERIKSALGDTGTALKQSAGGYEKQAQAVKKTGTAVDAVAPKVEGISDDWMNLGQRLLDAGASADETVTGLRQLGASANEAKAIVNALTGTTQQATQATQAQTQAAQAGVQAAQAQTQATARAAQAQQQAAAAQAQQKQRTQQWIQSLRQQIQARQQATQAQQQATQTQQQAAGPTQRQQRLSQALTRLYGQQTKATQQVAQTTQQMSTAQLKVKEAILALQPAWTRQGRLLNATVDDYQRVFNAGRKLGKSTKELGQFLQVPTEQADRMNRVFKKGSASMGRYSTSMRRLVKILGFWLIMGQVYFAILNFQRALGEAFKTVYKSTPEYQALVKATGDLGRAFILALAGPEAMAGILGDLSQAVQQLTADILNFAAVQNGVQGAFNAVTEAAEGNIDAQRELAGLMYSSGAGMAREEVIKQLEEINQKYNLGIDIAQERADAEGEVRDAFESTAEAARKLQAELNKLEEQRDKALIELEIDAQRKRADIEREWWRGSVDRGKDAGRRQLEIQEDYQRKLEDIEREGANRRAEIDRDFRDKRQQYIDQYNLRVWDTTWQHHQSMLRIEQNYQRSLRSIQQTYEDSMWDAVGERNATMALKAERTRKQQIKEAQIRRKEDRGNEEKNYKHQLELLRKQLDLQLKEQKQEHKRQLEELKYSLQEQREEAEIQRRRDLEDLAQYLRDQTQDARDSQRDRLEDLDRYLDERRRDIDWEYWYEQQTAINNNTWAEQEEERHWEQMYTIRLWGIRRMQALTGTTGRTYRDPNDPHRNLQQGGSFIADRRTHLTVGEGSHPELVQVIPLSGAYQHQHNFGAMTHNVNAMVEQSVAGMEGRLQAAFVEMSRELFT